jgi:hypothetical protein
MLTGQLSNKFKKIKRKNNTTLIDPWVASDGSQFSKLMSNLLSVNQKSPTILSKTSIKANGFTIHNETGNPLNNT